MKKTHIYQCIALATASISLPALAQQTEQQKLKTITIIGNNINNIDNTLPNVDIVNMDTLRSPNVSNIQSALKKNPAIEINNRNSPVLYLRGLGDNFTDVTLDGQSMQDYFVFGPFTSGGRDFVETDTIKQIDIIKGLQSPKQKSGALAGTVNLRTYNPSDFVDTDNPFYFSFKPSYTSKNKGVGASLALAGKTDRLGGMLIYTQRRYHETENMGIKKDDKQNIDQHNILAKGEFELPNAKLLLTGEYFDREQKTYRQGSTARPKENPTTRKRLSADTELYNLIGLDTIKLGTSLQKINQTDVSYGDKHNFKQQNINVHIDAEKTFNLGSTQHNWLLGMSYDTNKFDYKISSKRGDLRIIPLTKRNSLSAYLKDQIVFANGFSLSPGVRIEHKRLNVTVDKAYQNNPALSAQKNYIPHDSETSISPSINAVMPIGENAKVFASYARGIKSPDVGNIGGFDHGFGFIIPNPDLKEEKSNNYELGYSYVVPNKMEFKITGFYNQFSNFIDYKIDGFFGTTPIGSPKSIMRPYNIAKAKTYGTELEIGYHINSRLYGHAALALMKGRLGNEASHGVPLSKAYPQKAILGLTYNHNEQWGGDIDWTLVGRGQKTTREDGFRTPGYGVVDVTAWWKPVKNMTLTAGIYNITDKKYWLSADVNGAKKSDVDDSYTQPGRNFAVNFNYEF